ncbi:hotdog domain-containing protein [Actinoplanes oblitus]|uniref:Hotdog domain-containing protein n=1 Tax=Actinoplanes oblitus TaxID=3040509 RepID=A0ABY8WTZ0_9ACTN|nr:hotdog domain-containing protein [Actinoplanes oblitus]WIN00386.1 hotdog domain-containing protein [Actinoplanes oblitus]
MDGHAVTDDGTGLTHRREAITELGDALRALVEQATVTEAPTGDLLRAAAGIRDVIDRLGGRTRDPAALPRADDLLGGIRLYNPVTGGGSALAPPLRVEVLGGTAIGRCTLGMAFEGPPRFAHGGVSAMLLDQLLGHTVVAAGRPGMTVRLDTAYHAPVPLLTPLLLTAEVREVDGRRVTATGTIATEAEPGTLLVTATGTFVGLRADQTRRLFGPVLRPQP